MKIKVEQRHIDLGLRRSCSNCPVALAIKDAIGNRSVNVDSDNVFIEGCRYVLPSVATDFIIRFDLREPVKPFEFEIDYEA